jgi:hypothetical protein
MGLGPENQHLAGVRSAAETDAEVESQLQALREEFPGWDFIKIFAGWLAVPKGTPVVQGMDLGSVAGKLREHEDR